MRSIPFSPLFAGLALLLAVGCAGRPDVPDDAGPAEILELAAARRSEGDLTEARKLFEYVAEEYPTTAEGRRAGWEAGETAYRADELKKARRLYQTFHENHPLDHLGELENRLFDIGVRLYEGGRSGLLGLGILPTSSDGIQTLEWLVTNLPSGSRADDAYIFLARARMEEHEEDQAVLDLEQLLKQYPESEWVLEARFLLGEAWLALNRGPAYDREALLQARKAYRGYVAAVEEDPVRRSEYAERLEEARAALAEIDRRLAAKNLLIAEFYLDQERPRAASIYLSTAADEFGSTEEGARAREILDGLDLTETEEE